jgi:hypothetical protein
VHANGQRQRDDIELVVLADKAGLVFAIVQIIDGQLKLFFGFYNTHPSSYDTVVLYKPS